MTILNVSIAPDLGLVAVDTAVPTPSGGLTHVSKLMPLPHADAVVAARGHLLMLVMLSPRLQQVAGDFDNVLAALHDSAVQAFADSASACRGHGAGNLMDEMGHEVVAVGYSPRAGRVLGVLYDRKAGGDGFAFTELDDFMQAPWDESLARFRGPTSTAAMVRLARAQARYARAQGHENTHGGRLVIAEVRRGGINVSSDTPLETPLSVISALH